MKIEMKPTKIRDIVDGYIDNSYNEEGIYGYEGKLNIRPKYQREFIYNNEQQKLVMDSIMRGLPLGIIYWAKNKDGTYEVLDGQQRIISLASFVKGNYSIDGSDGRPRYFHSGLTENEKEQILDYELLVFVAEGSEKDKLEWFKTINIAGEELTEQELRNAIYTGPWLEDAKRHFSKTAGPAYQVGKDYLRGTPIRQDYLETVIKWKAEDEEVKGSKPIDKYMAIHQNDKDADEIWQYFRAVIHWVEGLFPVYRKEMKGINWGVLYNEYKDTYFNSNDLAEKVKILMADDDVSSKRGIYEYLITGKERNLSIRSFTPSQKREAYERQDGICSICEEEFDFEDMEGDHITPWSMGGRTISENCQMLCQECNRRKGNI